MEKEINDYFREITQELYAEAESRLEKYGLVKGQAQLLLLIRDNEGCTQKDLANYYNVKCEELSTSSNSIGNELREGNPVIVSVGAGPNHFTTNGHFIVLTGIDDNGNVTVNDPNGAHDSYSANIYNLDQLCNSGEIQSARAFYT